MSELIDFSVFYGSWPNYPVKGALADVAGTINADIALVSPLAAVWGRNQQQYNDMLLKDIEPFRNLYAASVLDISLSSWREEAQRCLRSEKVKAFRLFPNYSNDVSQDSYSRVFEFFASRQLPLIIQKRMEDSRYNHPRAVVQDVELEKVLEPAQDYRDLRLILGGVKGGELEAERILKHQHLYLDTSQMDGFQVFRRAIDSGLLERLLFGSFTPMFEPGSGLRRLLPEISNAEAEKILYKNAKKLIGETIS